MKRSLTVLLIVGVFVVAGFAQSNRSSRPRVVTTPTPAPKAPTITGESGSQRRSGPPVLIGRTPQGEEPLEDAVVKEDGEDVIKVDTNIVTMPVSVLDRNGRFISGLSKNDFKIFENGVEHQVEFFESVEQPFTVILMIDTSPSTQYQIDEIHRAAITFVDQLRANDRVMVMSFDENVRTLSPATSNRYQLHDAIRSAQFGNGTSLYEAVDKAINQELRRIQGRKAVVLFTDGVDTTSRRADYQSTLTDAEEVDALFYPIRYDTQRDGFGGGNQGGGGNFPSRQPKGVGGIIGIILGGGNVQIGNGRGRSGTSSNEYETGRRYLEELARTSGGRKFEATSYTNLEAAFSGIAEELRRQYSLGYYPENPGQKGERKQIRVRVMRQNVVVRAKTSYIVGSGADANKFAGR